MRAAGIRRRCVVVAVISAVVLVTSGCNTLGLERPPANGPRGEVQLPDRGDRVRKPANGPRGDVQLRDRRDRVQETGEGDSLQVSLLGFTEYAVQQLDADACWAACAEMIGRYNGVELAQREIAERVRGGSEAEIRAANLYEIMQALNPDLAPFNPFDQIWSIIREQLTKDPRRRIDIDLDLRSLISEGSKHLPSRTPNVDELRRGHPLVLGIRPKESEIGHVVVVFGLEYRRRNPVIDSVQDDIKRRIKGKDWLGPFGDAVDSVLPGSYEIVAVSYLDPADASVHTRRWAEIESEVVVHFVLSASTARERLLGWKNLVR